MGDSRTGKNWLAIISLLLIAALALTPVLDREAEAKYEALFQRALVTFALARTLNGVVSTIQGTELALQPAGVGVTLTPGEILDPVNDLVERFSWIMLGATVSLGVQHVLLEVSAWWALQALVVVLSLVMTWLVLRERSSQRVLRIVIARALLIALFLRFAVPMTLIINDGLYQWFLETRYTDSTEVISEAGLELEKLGNQGAEYEKAEETVSNGSLLGVIGRAADAAAETLNLRVRVQEIKQQAAAMIEHVIQLSVIFIFQAGVLPIAFLWIFLQTLKSVFRPIKT